MDKSTPKQANSVRVESVIQNGGHGPRQLGLSVCIEYIDRQVCKYESSAPHLTALFLRDSRCDISATVSVRHLHYRHPSGRRYRKGVSLMVWAFQLKEDFVSSGSA